MIRSRLLHVVNLLLGVLLFAGVAHARTFEWTVPAPAELSMTSDPKAPGAPAIILSYQRFDDSDPIEVLIHFRIKILTDAGLAAANVDISGGIDFFARTIHPDGTIIPYIPPSNTIHAALPNVTVGSIVEYYYHLNPRYSRYDTLSYNPTWLLQSKYFMREAHFTFKKPDRLQLTDIHWSANLPPGAQLQPSRNTVELEVANVPAAPDEELMPPPTAVIYNVRFYFLTDSRDKFWGKAAGLRDERWSYFCRPSKSLNAAVSSMVLASDSDRVKLHKIYTAVQQLENSDYTRQLTQREAKINGVSAKAQDGDDIWNRKRGSSEELTLLFVALARAAGFEAYPMAVASRNLAVFSPDVLSWGQLDSLVAIVVIHGQETFHDPGVRRCPFGQLAPAHANVTGISVEGKLVKFRVTPSASARASHTDRAAVLTIDAGGSATGTATVSWYGTAGLPFRIKALAEDEQAVRFGIQQTLQALAPSGIELELKSVEALSDPDSPLVAHFVVSGKFSESTAKRLIIPAEFFASTEKPLLAAERRTTPVAFEDVTEQRDRMVLHLPPGLVAETLPSAQFFQLGTDSSFSTRIEPPSEEANAIVIARAFNLNRLDYAAAEYPILHRYFAQVAASDQDRIVLAVVQSAAGN